MAGSTWITTLPEEYQEHSQEMSEEEYMAAATARKDSPQRPVEENETMTGDKSTTGDDTATKSGSEGEAMGMATRLAPAKSRKRKAADETAADNPASKKSKKAPTKAEDGKSMQAPAPEKTKKRFVKVEDTGPDDSPTPKRRKAIKSKGRGKTETQSIDTLPASLPPAAVSQPVAHKIAQVHNYIDTHPESKLHRDFASSETEDLINISEQSLYSVLSIIYWHYELGTQPELPLSDVENGIIDYYQQERGSSKILTNFFTIDAAKMTNLEERVQEKIIRHGLEDAKLLKIEIEMYNERISTRMGEWRPYVENLLGAVDDETGGSNKKKGDVETGGDVEKGGALTTTGDGEKDDK